MNTLEFHRQGDLPQVASYAEMDPATRDVVAGARETKPAVISQVLTIARRRKWIIIGALALCVLTAIVLTMLMTPKYTASALIEIQRETGSFINVEGAEPKSSYIDQEFYETEYGLLKSDMLAQRVAQDLRLYDDPGFFLLTHAGPPIWFEGGHLNPGASTREQRIRAAGDALLNRLTVKPERLSRLVTISMKTPNAALSQRLINAWTATFVKVTLERRYGTTAYARHFLEQRLADLRNRLDGSERRLVSYARQQGIVNLPGSGATGANTSDSQRSLASENLVTLNAALSQAIADRIQNESRVQIPGDQATEGLNNATISSLRSRRAELSADYAKMMTQFEPQYPQALALKKQIDQLDLSIRTEEGRVSGTLRQSYASSRARERELQQSVNTAKSDVLNLRQRSIEYNILQRDIDTSRQLYDALLQRYKEIGVAGGVGVNNISVVDDAPLPLAPSSPNLILNLALGIAVGLLLGLGAAVVAEQLDQGISDPSEVEAALGVPVIGTIPKTAEKQAVDSLQDPKSVLSEAYFSLQTNLAFATTHGMPRTILVTSTRAAEGKSTTSYALARSIARASHRVILIDADMRSPSVQNWVGRPNRMGLSNYLAGNDDLAAMIEPTSFKNMSLMFAGPQPPSAPELLSGNRIEKLIEILSEQFDHIVFDAPPVMGLADAPLLGGRVEATLFVLEAGSTQRTMARVAIDRLRVAHAALVGVTLTKFDLRRAHFGYGYSYGYGYGYGDASSSEVKAGRV